MRYKVFGVTMLVLVVSLLLLACSPSQYTLDTFVSPPGGTGAITIIPHDITYDADTEVTLNAEPAPGWSFDKWIGDATGEKDTVTIIMDKDKSVTACFKQAGPTSIMMPSPQPPPTKPYQEQPLKTYTAYDNVYQFTYPGDWEDITTEIYSGIKAYEEDPKSPETKPDIALGKFEDRYHRISIHVFRWVCVGTIDKCLQRWWFSEHGYQTANTRINGRDALIATYDSPSNFYKQVRIHQKTNVTAFAFIITGAGTNYYEQVDYIYQILTKDLKIVEQTYEQWQRP